MYQCDQCFQRVENSPGKGKVLPACPGSCGKHIFAGNCYAAFQAYQHPP